MGQTLSLATLPGGAAGIDVPELADLTYEKSLGTARFMKSIRARHQYGLVVVKLVMKPYAHVDLAPYVKAIRSERDALVDVPNALGYQRVFETSTNGYLVRQYLYSSLYDRMSTRPFLEDIEKKWLAYQLLCALRDSHAHDVFHGDIKTENILVTSWNWLYLTDYSASYKQTFLPEDNPADFSYYFDTSGRRTCYLAPERFRSLGSKDDAGGITWAMDVFSAGCVIAELFTEAPIFSLSQLYKYKNGEYDPRYGYLGKILDEDIRELVSHMIQLQPESRYFAEEYLNFWRRKAFPEYFYSFLHQYMGSITDPSSGRASVLPETLNFGEADNRIDKVYIDFDKISYLLGYDNVNGQDQTELQASLIGYDVIPVQIDVPNNRHLATATGKTLSDDGSLIFLTLVVSCLRNTARSSARIQACDLMLAFAERITDEAKMDRVLPYVVALLNDRVDKVKVAAIRTIAQLLSLVRVVSPVNAYAFTEYIKPRLQQFIGGPGLKTSSVVRATYASCVASLAHSSGRILDMIQALRADGTIPTVDPDAEDGAAMELAYQNSFDHARADLLDHFETHAKALLTDENASVRRAFLGSVSSLCVFFGSTRANDVILSHLNTYLNDKDWILKCAFFRTIVGVASFVGGPSLEEFILPLMIQALTDAEDFIVCEVLSSLASIAELGLFQRPKTWEMVDIVARFMMHPNIWIREAAVHFVAASTRYISVADRHCIIAPLIQPYLKAGVTEFTNTNLLDTLKRPLPYSMFELAIVWATKAKTGLFWKSVGQLHTFSFGIPERTLSTISSKELRPSALSGVAKNEEDEKWIKMLREIGMTTDDESKLLALREYIWRLSTNRLQAAKDIRVSPFDNIIRLKDFGITPQTVFFETEKRTSKTSRRASHGDHRSTGGQNEQGRSTHTIADALLDASSAMDNPLGPRKRTEANFRKEGKSGKPLPPSLPLGDQEMTPNRIDRLPTSTSRRQTSRDPSGLVARPGDRQIPTEGAEITNSDGTITPANSSRAGSVAGRAHIKHKSSAINLLNRRDTSKTTAGTSTYAANVMGEMEGPFNGKPSGTLGKVESAVADGARGTASPTAGDHSYSGKDPSVMRLLDSLASESYPRDIVDFGPLITPVNRRHSAIKADSRNNEKPWTPHGTLIGTFGEHTAPITRVVPSPDHAFFITGSDDGTVKIWDTLRLERNLAHRSRQTFIHAEGAKVKALCFVENTHTFVSAANDGSIKVVKVDYSIIGDSPKYGRLRVVREYQLPIGDHALWFDHAKTESHSLLLLATNSSKIVALDLRDMAELYTLTNPIHHGTPTCFCVNYKQGWLVLGTSHGILDLWDLRFHLRLKAWGLVGGTRIHRVAISPFHSHGRKICVTGGTGQTDVTVWDLETNDCCEVFRTGVTKGSSKDILKSYEAWKVDDEKPEGILGRFATAIGPIGGGNDGPDKGIHALAIKADGSDDVHQDSQAGFLITGGLDKKLRFWDYRRSEASMVISGLDAEEPQPRYSTTRPTASLILHTERLSQQSPSAHNAEAGTTTKRSSAKQPRNTVISLQQQALLRNHLDEITDVCLLEFPVRMTVSVDRMGCIYVFQ
ncbi:MAG: hypothetical protein Q9163_001779 [Psora crenata]